LWHNDVGFELSVLQRDRDEDSHSRRTNERNEDMTEQQEESQKMSDSLVYHEIINRAKQKASTYEIGGGIIADEIQGVEVRSESGRAIR
jgi:hypothetical protein